MISRKVDDSDVLLVLLPQIRLFLLDVNVGVVFQPDVHSLLFVDLVQPVLLPMTGVEINCVSLPQLIEILVLLLVWNS